MWVAWLADDSHEISSLIGFLHKQQIWFIPVTKVVWHLIYFFTSKQKKVSDNKFDGFFRKPKTWLFCRPVALQGLGSDAKNDESLKFKTPEL